MRYCFAYNSFFGYPGCFVCWNKFFSVWVITYAEVFSYITFTETLAIGYQKSFDHKCIDFGVFCWNVAFLLTLYPYGLKFAEVPRTCFSFDDLVFSITSLKGILVCSLNLFVLFSRKTL